MDYVRETVQIIRNMRKRDAITQVLALALVVLSALMMWKGCMLLTGSESPIVVVLSGSMEPGFQRGDLLLLTMPNEPLKLGDIVVFKVFSASCTTNLSDFHTRGSNCTPYH